MEHAFEQDRPVGIGRQAGLSALLAVMALAAGCATRSSVIPLGQGDFSITKEASTGFFGTAGLKVDALQEATEYCANFGKALQVTNVYETKPPFVLSNYPRVDLQFKCVNRLFETEPGR